MSQRTRHFVVKGKSKTFYSLGVCKSKEIAVQAARRLQKDLEHLGYLVKTSPAVPPTFRAKGYYEIWIDRKMTSFEAAWHAGMK